MPPPDTITTTRVIDAVARVCATAIGVSEGDLDNHIFAAGVTDEVTAADPMVVPLADDFTEAGLPAVTVALGPWSSAWYGSEERVSMTLLCAVWRPRLPLGEVTAQLYADRDAIADAFLDRTKAFGHEPALQSAKPKGGPGIRSRSIPRVISAESGRTFLTLPFTVDVTLSRRATPQPA
jgi:hypothetical protein